MKLLDLRLLQPLRRRDFALLTVGSTISFLGDGFFYVALAWQAYKLSNVPTALSLVGLAWSLPTILFLLAGGVVGDRFDRRRVMAGADLLRAIALGLIGALSITGLLRLWQFFLIMPFVGTGDAFFNPASSAIIPDLLPDEELAQANALRGVTRPLTFSLLGPALGGLLVGLAGPGPAFLIDAASFTVSAVTVSAIATQPLQHTVERGLRTSFRDVAEGFAFVRANPWCWATLAAACLSLLTFWGPMQVILPFLVKNDLHSGAQGLGLVFAIGGVGSILVSIIVGQRDLPRRQVTVMYLTWAFGMGFAVVYGIMNALWQALAASLVINALFALGEIIWVTMMQRLVPGDLLSRVSSLDWLVSTGLVPLSYALTGPAAAVFGARLTIAGGGLLSTALFLVFLLIPGVRRPEQDQLAPPPYPALSVED